MSIVSTIYYPDPRRSLARESARCRRSPLPRRSLPVDVVDDRCEPSVFELTRREPRRSAPAKADSRLSGFGFDPVRNPNMCPGARNGFWIESRMAPPMRLCHTEEPTESSMPCVQRVRLIFEIFGQRPHDRQGISTKLDDVATVTFREVD